MNESNVVRFPGHKRTRCTRGERGRACGDYMTCILYSCETCGGAEASLPTHCPGERMDPLIEASVQDGSLDYRDGEWKFFCWDEGPTHAKK